MYYRQLGRTGLRVSALGLGGNIFGGPYVAHFNDEAQSISIIHRALELGINHIDTADVYARGVSEQFIGKAIAGRRHEVIVASKVGMKAGEGTNDTGASLGHIRDNVEQSLRNLGTDYIDLYYIHRFDPETPLEETLRALDDLVGQGKIRYPACSNFAAWQIAHAHGIAERRGYVPFAVVQSRYNMLERELDREVFPACRALGLGIVPFYPLAAGVLTGKYRRGEASPANARGPQNAVVKALTNEQTLIIVEKLEDFARGQGHTVGELAIAWLLAKPEIATVITGTTNIDQVEQNVRAVEWRLRADEMTSVEAILSSQ